MGMIMSFMGKGMQPSQMISLLTGKLYEQFIQKDVGDINNFHSAVLDMFTTINSGLPGKHYDAPSRREIEEFFTEWKQCPEPEKKNKFVDFMKERVNISKLDNFTVTTGVMTPPAAMAAKKAGENVPQLKMIKAIPDVIFVPSVTLLALISAKISRRIIRGKSEYSKSEDPHPPHEAHDMPEKPMLLDKHTDE